MPEFDRKAIYDALYAKLKAMTAPTGLPMPQFTRRQPAIDDLVCPMVCLKSVAEEHERPYRGAPTVTDILANIMLYTEDSLVDDPSSENGLFSYLGAIEDSLAPSPALGIQNLGGLVDDLWISGRISEYVATKQSVSLTVILVNIAVTH